jgi:hypothetical protein
MVDPEARSTERDIGYEWSNGRRFRDGIGAYEPTIELTNEQLYQQYLFYNPPPPEPEIPVTDNDCTGAITFEAIIVMHNPIEGDVTLPRLSVIAGVVYTLYKQLLSNGPLEQELIQQFDSLGAVYDYVYVYDPDHQFIMIAPDGQMYGYNWQTGSFGLPGE